MQNLNSTAIMYFTGAVLMSIIICLTLMIAVNWPMLAEIPLSISIFIQLLAISKSIYSFAEKADTESLEQVYSRLKGGVFDAKVKEGTRYVEQ